MKQAAKWVVALLVIVGMTAFAAGCKEKQEPAQETEHTTNAQEKTTNQQEQPAPPKDHPAH